MKQTGGIEKVRVERKGMILFRHPFPEPLPND
jgi:hypothetical protein